MLSTSSIGTTLGKENLIFEFKTHNKEKKIAHDFSRTNLGGPLQNQINPKIFLPTPNYPPNQNFG